MHEDTLESVVKELGVLFLRSRKVMVTGDDVSNALRNPKGYGRIRLWN
jgi:hypothetical protein